MHDDDDVYMRVVAHSDLKVPRRRGAKQRSKHGLLALVVLSKSIFLSRHRPLEMSSNEGEVKGK